MAHFKELATIISAVDLDDAGHIRVKELFESIEAFKFIANFIISAQRTRKLLSQPPFSMGNRKKNCFLNYLATTTLLALLLCPRGM